MATISSPVLVGREPEIELINRAVTSAGAAFLAVYGRRRVGKTFLIRQHLKKELVFDFTGTKEAATDQQLLNFYEEYKKRAGRRSRKKAPASWQEAFLYLAEYLHSVKKKSGSKVVVFIDEMPWLDTARSGFIHALEFFWNQHGSAMDHLLLVACGSASSWIRKKLIGARGGLYNRVTHRIELAAFNLHETGLLMESLGVKLPPYQLLEIYMAMGGIPFYLKEAAKGKSAAQIIDAACFSRQGLLRNEYSQLYHSLFGNAEQHVAVIEMLASKPRGLSRSELAAKTKLSEGTLSRTLEELQECGFISIYLPFLYKKKTTVYKLTDLYTLFYLKFIKPNKKEGRGTWLQLSKTPGFAAWSGYAFENICMAHINQVKQALGISGVHSSSSSWQFAGNDALPGAQIDMVLDRADQVIHLCEAKFTQENFVINKTYAEQLRLKRTVFKKATGTKKAVFTTLLTTFPALQNKYYLGEIQNEITMDKLFAPSL